MLDNMLKRIKTLTLRDLIIEINPGLPTDKDPTVADFLPLSENEVLQKGNTSLAGLQSLRLNLARLGIAPAGIRPSSIHFLTGIPLAETTILDLAYNEIGTEGMETLAQTGSFEKLEELILNSCAIGDAGAQAFSQMNMPKITKLHLRDNFIGNKGAEALSQMNLSNITFLDLSNNDVGLTGILALCDKITLSNKMTEVYMFVCRHRLSNEDIQALGRAAGLKNISDIQTQRISKFVINNVHVCIPPNPAFILRPL